MLAFGLIQEEVEGDVVAAAVQLAKAAADGKITLAPIPKDPIEVKQRIIVNYYTAKRLLAALNMSVQRHEAVFGVLETDIQKRLKNRQ